MAKVWIKEHEEIPKDNLIKASVCCYKNACGLYNDSKLLYENSRYTRSVAISILAEEEYSKAIILYNCAAEPRWDSVIWKALTSHGAKHAISELMRQIKYIVITKGEPITSLNLFEKQVIEISNSVKKTHMKDREVDLVKQSKFYVNINQNAEITNNPSSERKEAEKHLKLTEEVKSVSQIIFKDIAIQ